MEPRDLKEITAAFSGYRPEKMKLCGAGPGIRTELGILIREAVARLYGRGYRRFLSGMARGFDLWAAEAVLEMRGAGFADLRLTAVVPFRGQETSYDRASAATYRNILLEADEVEILARCYDKDCFRRRNDWMTDRASALVCYYTGLGGGTGYTVGKAAAAGLTVINLSRLTGSFPFPHP